jgi:hypothetical protein
MLANSINTDIAAGVAALPKAGGAMTGAITTNSTFDGVDVGVRDGVLTTTTTTANAALPKTGGSMTGELIIADTGTLDIRMGTDKRVTWSGALGEIGSVAGFQATNTAGSALGSFGMRGADLRFATGSAERVRITDTGVGIGTSLPSDKAHIAGGGLIVDKTNNGYSGARFHDDSGGDYNSYIDLGRNQGGTRLTIRRGGRVQGTTPWTNATPSPIVSFSNGGIAFGADTAAANTLNDYEEGTWAPVPGSSTLTIYQAAWYTKIGNTVTCSCYVYSFGDNSSSTAFTLTGLPFAHKTASEAFFLVPASGGVGAQPSGAIGINARIGQNGSDGISFYNMYPNTTGANTLLHSHLGAFHLQFTFTYITA